MINIGIFGPSEDQEVEVLRKRLLNRGVNPLVIDLSRFPQELTITVTNDDIMIDDYSLFDIQAAYLRSRGVRLLPFAKYDERFVVDSHERWETLHSAYLTYIESESKCQRIRNSVLQSFSQERPLVNPVLKNDLHRLKTYLFWHLKGRGVSVPRFMVGTSSKALRGFAEHAFERSQGAVTKPLAGIYKTYLWDEKIWEKHRWEERGAFYQYYIKGDTVRCYLLGGRVIASATILHGESVDSSMSQTGIEVMDLPEKAKRMVEHAAQVLGLSFCGMDLMREEDTENYYLIDCNISPMFFNFARLSRIDIPAQIADHLIESARSGDRPKPKELSLLKEAKDILANDPDIRKMLSGKP